MHRQENMQYFSITLLGTFQYLEHRHTYLPFQRVYIQLREYSGTCLPRRHDRKFQMVMYHFQNLNVSYYARAFLWGEPKAGVSARTINTDWLTGHIGLFLGLCRMGMCIPRYDTCGRLSLASSISTCVIL